jgi:hypothetical protein
MRTLRGRGDRAVAGVCRGGMWDQVRKVGALCYSQYSVAASKFGRGDNLQEKD